MSQHFLTVVCAGSEESKKILPTWDGMPLCKDQGQDEFATRHHCWHLRSLPSLRAYLHQQKQSRRVYFGGLLSGGMQLDAYW